jgi:2-dehydro-3-deoxyphosphogluconate aldolase/(4S)-4-hydroxy-2-oxoglutarate aldolase
MDRILKTRVVPVATIARPEDAPAVAEALRAGGIDIIEVTFRAAGAARAIANILRTFPDMLVGAGTVLDTAQVDEALDAGAKFAVAPGLNEAVVRHALQKRLPFVPGVATASEVERAMHLGCKLLKFFPAAQAGGPEMLKALAGPYGHTGVRFIPLGGIKPSNAADYLALPIVAAVGGTWIAPADLIDARNWNEITRRSAQAVQIAAGGIR